MSYFLSPVQMRNESDRAAQWAHGIHHPPHWIPLFKDKVAKNPTVTLVLSVH